MQQLGHEVGARGQESREQGLGDGGEEEPQEAGGEQRAASGFIPGGNVDGGMGSKGAGTSMSKHLHQVTHQGPQGTGAEDSGLAREDGGGPHRTPWRGGPRAPAGVPSPPGPSSLAPPGDS